MHIPILLAIWMGYENKSIHIIIDFMLFVPH